MSRVENDIIVSTRYTGKGPRNTWKRGEKYFDHYYSEWKSMEKQWQYKYSHYEAQVGQFRLESDPFLERHNTIVFCDSNGSDITPDFQRFRSRFVHLNNSRRNTNTVFSDRDFYVSETVMMPGNITWRAEKSRCVVPTSFPYPMDVGYFPLNVVGMKNQKKYITQRYKEAVFEYLNLRPRPDLVRKFMIDSSLEEIEMPEDLLFEYHGKGRHIHGFFLHVKWCNGGESRTYLLDVYNFFMFPTYIIYEEWDTRLKFAFDNISAHNLEAAEFYNENQIIVDSVNVFRSYFEEDIRRLMSEYPPNPENYCNLKGVIGCSNEFVYKDCTVVCLVVKNSPDELKRMHRNYGLLDTGGAKMTYAPSRGIDQFEFRKTKRSEAPIPGQTTDSSSSSATAPESKLRLLSDVANSNSKHQVQPANINISFRQRNHPIDKNPIYQASLYNFKWNDSRKHWGYEDKLGSFQIESDTFLWNHKTVVDLFGPGIIPQFQLFRDRLIRLNTSCHRTAVPIFDYHYYSAQTLSMSDIYPAEVNHRIIPPSCPHPMDDGYFPLGKVGESERKKYLFKRYGKAYRDYVNLRPLSEPLPCQKYYNPLKKAYELIKDFCVFKIYKEAHEKSLERRKRNGNERKCLTDSSNLPRYPASIKLLRVPVPAELDTIVDEHEDFMVEDLDSEPQSRVEAQPSSPIFEQNVPEDASDSGDHSSDFLNQADCDLKNQPSSSDAHVQLESFNDEKGNKTEFDDSEAPETENNQKNCEELSPDRSIGYDRDSGKEADSDGIRESENQTQTHSEDSTLQKACVVISVDSGSAGLAGIVAYEAEVLENRLDQENHQEVNSEEVSNESGTALRNNETDELVEKGVSEVAETLESLDDHSLEMELSPLERAEDGERHASPNHLIGSQIPSEESLTNRGSVAESEKDPFAPIWVTEVPESGDDQDKPRFVMRFGRRTSKMIQERNRKRLSSDAYLEPESDDGPVDELKEKPTEESENGLDGGLAEPESPLLPAVDESSVQAVEDHLAEKDGNLSDKNASEEDVPDDPEASFETRYPRLLFNFTNSLRMITREHQKFMEASRKDDRASEGSKLPACQNNADEGEVGEAAQVGEHELRETVSGDGKSLLRIDVRDESSQPSGSGVSGADSQLPSIGNQTQSPPAGSVLETSPAEPSAPEVQSISSGEPAEAPQRVISRKRPIDQIASSTYLPRGEPEPVDTKKRKKNTFMIDDILDS